MARLVLPSIKYKKSYFTAYKEFKKERRPSMDYAHIKDGENFDDFVRRIKGFRYGRGLPKGKSFPIKKRY